MNTDLYRKCKLRGYHIPIMSGRDLVELPGRTEKVEMAFSNVFVDISSNHCVAQVYLTNYRSEDQDILKKYKYQIGIRG